MIKKGITASLLLCYFFTGVFSSEIPGPLIYPEIKTTNSNPFIVWENIYPDNDKNTGSKYKLSLQSADKKFSREYIITPQEYYKNYYTHKIQDALDAGDYHCKIERLVSLRPAESKYFYYLNYPLIFSFSVDPGIKYRVDFLPPEYLIKYLYFEKNNLSINGYNSLFLTASGILSFGLGMLFLEVITLGAISVVLYSICFTAAAVGIGTGGYYGYRYFHYRSELKKIVELGSNASLKSGGGDGVMNTGVELTF